VADERVIEPVPEDTEIVTKPGPAAVTVFVPVILGVDVVPAIVIDEPVGNGMPN
jgi:hypothetical protein